MVEKLDPIEIPEDYEVLDAEALAQRLGFKRQTILAYMTRGQWDRIPKPHRHLAVGHIWYLGAVKKWESNRSDS